MKSSWFSVLVFCGVLFHHSALGRVVETKGEVDVFYRMQSGKLVKWAKSGDSQKFKYVGRTRSKRWIAVEWGGKRAWLKRGSFRVLKNKRVASRRDVDSTGVIETKWQSQQKESAASRHSVILSLSPAIQNNDFGIGFGGGVSLTLLDRVINNPLELGLYGYFYPDMASASLASSGISASAFSAFATVSTMFLGTQTTGLGLEAGFSLLSSQVSASSSSFFASGEETSSTDFSLSLGPAGRLALTDSIHLNGGLRMQFFASTLLQIYAGIGFGF